MQCAAHSAFSDYVNIINVKMHWTRVKNLLLFMMNNTKMRYWKLETKMKYKRCLYQLGCLSCHSPLRWSGYTARWVITISFQLLYSCMVCLSFPSSTSLTGLLWFIVMCCNREWDMSIVGILHYRCLRKIN